MDIKEQFEHFTRPQFFSRVVEEHVLDLHIGLDEKGRKSFELRSKFNPVKVTGTSSIDVNQYKKEEYNTLRFSLKDDDVSGLFYKFCEDIIEQTEKLKDEREGYKTIINRYSQWKKMFVLSKKDYLTEPEIMGLIGELLFLSTYLKETLGLSTALKSWSGQELTHKDFSCSNTWYEVKTINKGHASVRISSLEQLESDKDGELVIYSLEKMSEKYNGISLNKLIIKINNMFESNEEKDAFMAKVALQGYEYSNLYDNYVYEVSDVNYYKVDSSFPKLTKEFVPQAVIKATYDLSLTDLTSFKIER